MELPNKQREIKGIYSSCFRRRLIKPSVTVAKGNSLSSFIEQKEKGNLSLTATCAPRLQFALSTLNSKTTIESLLVRGKRLNLVGVSEKKYILRVKTTMEL